MSIENFLRLPNWLRSNVFYRAKLNNDSGEWTNSKHDRVHPYDANLISSETLKGEHYLLLDLDVEHWYESSSTTDHGHLAINIQLKLEEIKEIIDVLTKHGILQNGIKRQFEERGHLSLRMPGMTKSNEQDNMSLKEVKEWEQKKKQKN